MNTSEFSVSDVELVDFVVRTYLEAYRSHKAMADQMVSLLEDEDARKQLLNSLPPSLASYFETQTRDQLEQEGPELIAAWAVAVAIVAALKRQGKA